MEMKREKKEKNRKKTSSSLSEEMEEHFLIRFSLPICQERRVGSLSPIVYVREL
jgi:hypothetical protein